jgi:glycosyltransferase involved in cell wall biosynthesis
MARFLFYDDKLINVMLQEEKPCGGSAVQSFAWIMGLIEEGQEVYVMTEDPGKSLVKKECSKIKLVPMFEPHKGVRWLRWLYYRLPHTYKNVKEVKPDYLYVGIPAWTSFLVGLMCRFLKIKLIHRISSDIQIDKRFGKEHGVVHQFFMNLGFRLSHHILCQNNYQMMMVRKKFPGKSAIKVFNPFYAKKEEVVEDIHSKGYIAWVGIYRYPKNLKRLYEIASILRNEQFLVAGKVAAKSDAETIHYLEKLKHLPNVSFPGYLQRAQVMPFIANAKFLLNTSRYEGFSNTFLEALSVGTPVLSGVQVNPDSIISKFNLGIIYNDVFELCKQYASVTPELYQLMSNNARSYVAHYHGYRLLARNLLRYLSECDKIRVRNNNRMAQLTDQTTHA